MVRCGVGVDLLKKTAENGPVPNYCRKGNLSCDENTSERYTHKGRTRQDQTRRDQDQTVFSSRSTFRHAQLERKSGDKRL